MAGLRDDGTIVVWSTTDADPNYTNIPATAANIVQISGANSGSHFVALRQNGTVLSWGQPGAGPQTTVPAGISNIVQVAAGNEHTLALKSNGTVAAWGGNYLGNTSVPSGLSNVVSVASGATHSLALKSDGTAVAWGRTNQGQCAVPPGLSNVVQVAAGYTFSLALKSDGTVVPWGEEFFFPPTPITNAVHIACGAFHGIAVLSDRTVVAWGGNLFNQTNVPTDLSNVVQLAGGYYSTIALIDSTPVPIVTVEHAPGSVLPNNAAASLLPCLADSQSDARVYTLRNSGGGVLNNIVVTKSGSNSSNFALVAPTTNSLDPAALTTFSVRFAPKGESGLRTAQISITSNDSNNSPFVINLSGFGLGEDLDTDGDGLNDAAEFTMSALGFDWQSSQPTLVTALYSNANRANLFTQLQYDDNRARGREDGIADVIVSPTAYGLYDSTSIMDLRMGGLMIQKQGTDATIVFQPQTTTDLATLPFTNSGTPITNAIPMPGDKGFLRVEAIYVPTGNLINSPPSGN